MSSRTLILGTAGHVDHGKTALVRALTGIDTDRLEEEHRRGISIELGFAHLDLGDGWRLGIVDVPGHERFVRQMVAGAGGMDLAMLLVAADEGVMPQTREHLDVLQVLGVPAGVVVVTKTDLAEPDLREVVEAEVRDLVKGTFLENAPVVQVSAHRQEGLEALRAVLRALVETVPAKNTDGDFREPIDRVFAKAGAGVVITGTAWSGAVKVGDTLRLLPADAQVRVREVQSHGEAVEMAHAGARVALAIHGVKREQIERGDVLVSGRAWQPADILGVRVHLVPDASVSRLRQRARLHVHHAAREVLGRIELLEDTPLTPGASALARLHLESPLMARAGDRLVLRSYSPMITVAGGLVLDPQAPRKQRRADALTWLVQLEQAGTAREPFVRLRAAGLAGLPRATLVDRLGMLGVDATGAQQLVEQEIESGRAILLGDHVFAREALDAAAPVALALLRAHQTKQPLSAGLSKEELRQALGFGGSPQIFAQLLAQWATSHPIFPAGDRVRADTAAPHLDPQQERALDAFEDRIAQARPAYQASAEEMKMPELALLVGAGRVVKLGGRLLASRAMLDDVIAKVGEHFASHDVLEVAELKEWTGASRKFAVPILEWLDAQEVTRFEGGGRRRGPACP